MTQLINADALKETINAHDYVLKDCLNTTDKGMFTVGIMQAIDEQPTIDAEPHWIPCNERLPEDDTEVIVSCTDDSGDSEFSYTTTGWHFKGMWVVGNERSYFVRAWMPMPKPYEENYD